MVYCIYLITMQPQIECAYDWNMYNLISRVKKQPRLEHARPPTNVLQCACSLVNMSTALNQI